MRGGQGDQVAGVGGNTADNVTLADAVVVIIMGAWDQFRCTGTATRQLKKGDFIACGRGCDEVARGFSQQRVEAVFRLSVMTQDHLLE